MRTGYLYNREVYFSSVQLLGILNTIKSEYSFSSNIDICTSGNYDQKLQVV